MNSQGEKTYAEAGGAFVPSIQGLRGVAALTVLIDHFCDMPKGASTISPIPAFCRRYGRGFRPFSTQAAMASSCSS